MGRLAFVFPGQGAQSVGMGHDVYEHHEGARQRFDLANQTLGFDLSGLIFNGPEEQLRLTYHTQPALLTASMALYEVFKEIGIKPDYVAGHSLGEYSALVIAGVMSFEDAVRTVYARGQFMDQAVPAGKGSMAAVLGADRDKLQELCADVSRQTDVVEMANINCPGQIVVSGSVQGVQGIVERGKEAGAKRVIPLEVSGPFHSSLMKPAAKQLEKHLSSISLQDAATPVVANVTAAPVQSAEQIRKLLVDQVCSPVLWEDSIAWLINQGVDTFVEIGSGTVLAGLIKKINRKAKTISINTEDSIEASKELLLSLKG